MTESQIRFVKFVEDKRSGYIKEARAGDLADEHPVFRDTNPDTRVFVFHNAQGESLTGYDTRAGAMRWAWRRKYTLTSLN